MPRFAQVVCEVGFRAGFTGVARRLVARRRVSILTYHDPKPDQFEAHLGYLARRYSFVSLDRVADALESRNWDALPDFPVVLTFDDGWRGNAAIADICRRFNCPIMIYVASQIVNTGRHYWSTETTEKERFKRMPNAERIRLLVADGLDPAREFDPSERQTLTLEEARRMSDVASFGSHTRFHPVLTACNGDEAYEEIAGSKEEIEALLGTECGHLAFPYGQHTARERNMAAKAGYRTARTNDAGWNDARADPFDLRAFGIPDDAPVSRLAAELAGVGYLWLWKQTRRWDGRRPVTQPTPAHRAI